MSFLMSSSHLFFGLPSGLLNIGFHLYTFFYHSFFWHSMQMAKPTYSLCFYVIYYVLMSLPK
jgi:hypothetical protein